MKKLIFLSACGLIATSTAFAQGWDYETRIAAANADAGAH
jgi:Skp family chaperone for outer membrane proteins